MNDFLVESVLRGVLGGGRKRSRNALSYLTGRRGGDFVNAGTLLTAAGVAWGIYETLQNQGSAPSSGSAGSTTGSAGAPASVSLPPLPQANATAGDGDAVRMVRLAISAARADGTMNEQERAAILQQATAAGAADFVARELDQPGPLSEIVAGVGDPAQRATLYVLAYTIVRADEQVSGAERIYLAQLAHLLGLDPATVQTLEKETAARIDAAGEGGSGG
ncbi:MAG TPA: DUF533 domain-containing protein [Vicinamibacterales bacterium]